MIRNIQYISFLANKPSASINCIDDSDHTCLNHTIPEFSKKHCKFLGPQSLLLNPTVEYKFYDPSRFFDEYIGQDEIIIDEKAIPQINTQNEKAHTLDQNMAVEMNMASIETEPVSQITHNDKPYLQQ